MTAARFIEQARRTRLLVVGDVMADAYLWGRVERISPEAPVPVVQVHDRSARLGGAANVGLNARAFGATAIVAAVVGDDDHAHTLQRLFADQGLPTHGLVRSAARRTTVKTRIISGHQHIVRVDEEQEDPLAAADEDRLLAAVTAIVDRDKPDVIVLEDYDKGVLTPRTIAAIIERAVGAGIPVAVDPKKRNFTAYRGVDLFKPNLKELREGLGIDVAPTDPGSLRAAADALHGALGNKAALITLGEHGVYATDGKQAHRIAAHHRSIADVSGAGDTVITVAALAMAQGLGLEPLARMANLAGGLVCEHVGVVPIDAERFRAECERTGTLP
ncbi:MAG: bifunctional ADP-heptose synthase [Flavobacteriales bacterium]|jgi:rfaE bifunctional protein kinase chain/domain|nr:bifunctional ADP-heptose synthase [Flavobacteriales bacterium]